MAPAEHHPFFSANICYKTINSNPKLVSSAEARKGPSVFSNAGTGDFL